MAACGAAKAVSGRTVDTNGTRESRCWTNPRTVPRSSETVAVVSHKIRNFLDEFVG